MKGEWILKNAVLFILNCTVAMGETKIISMQSKL